jgi:murein DD-endopeptidase MepM/ murein hydrolase activator NlpD
MALQDMELPRLSGVDTQGGIALPVVLPVGGANLRVAGTETLFDQGVGASLSDAAERVVRAVDAALLPGLKAEAERRGREAGNQPLFNPDELNRQSFTTLGQAYQKGATETYVANIELDRARAFGEMELKYANDPVKLEESLRGYIKGVQSTLPEAMKTNYELMNEARVQNLVFPARQAELERAAKVRVETLKAQEQLYRAEALSLSSESGEMARPVQAAALASLEENWRAQGMSEAFIQVQRNGLSNEMTMEAQVARYRSLGANPDDPMGRAKVYSALLQQSPEALGYVPDSTQTPEAFKQTLLNRMEAVDADEAHSSNQLKVHLTWEQELDISLKKEALQARVTEGVATREEIILFGKQYKLGTHEVAGQLTRLTEVQAKQQAALLKEQQDTLALYDGGFTYTPASDARGLDNVILNAVAKDKGLAGASLGFVMPVKGVVTSGFGNRTSPTAGASHYHKGLDFGVPLNTPVAAAGAGTVIYAGTDKANGNMVKIKHTNGYVSVYAHLNQLGVKEGQALNQGQTLGLSGNTGISTGPHLHFQLNDAKGNAVDPHKALADKPKALPNLTFDEVIKYSQLSINRYGVIATNLLTLFGRELNSTSGTRVVKAADTIERLSMQNPEVAKQFDGDNFTLATMINHNQNLGLSGTEAVARAKGELAKGQQRIQQGLKLDKPVKDFMANQNPVTLFSQGGYWGLGVEVPTVLVQEKIAASLKSDYEQLVQINYDKTADLQLAAKNAQVALRQVWGVTRMNGRPEVMRYPPERFYKVAGAPANWIQQQALTLVRQTALVPKGWHTTEVHLMGDGLTAQMVAQKQDPVYKVLYKNRAGEIVPLLNANDVPVAFRPDVIKARKSVQASVAKPVVPVQKTVAKPVQGFSGFDTTAAQKAVQANLNWMGMK